jgi:hypothetical protein
MNILYENNITSEQVNDAISRLEKRGKHIEIINEIHYTKIGNIIKPN